MSEQIQDGLTPDQQALLATIDPVAVRARPELSREDRRRALETLQAAQAQALLATEAKILDLREPGEDDVDGEDVEDKARTLGQRALRLSPAGLRAKPRPREFLLRDANTGAGVMVRGKVGMLAAAGGTGKSYSLTQLCVAIATGTTWFGPGGWAPSKPGRVLGLFAEEDDEELERRTHYCARAAGLTSDDDLQLLADNFTAIPLAGCGVALTTRGDDGDALPETSFVAAIRELLWDAMRESRPYDLIVLDPLSRFAGADVETDNSAATRFIQVIESLCAPECGGAGAILSHHTKKKGENDDPDSADLIRGASGLVNGVRWAARLEQQKRLEGAADLVTLRIVKANGVPPQFSPLVLVRDQEHEGALRVATRDEIESNEAVAGKLRTKLQTIENVGDRVIAALRGGITLSRSELAKSIGGNRQALLHAISRLIEDGELESIGSGNRSAVRLVSLSSVPSVPDSGTEEGKPFNPSGSQFPTTPEGGGDWNRRTAGSAGTAISPGPGTEAGTEAEPKGE